MPRILVIDDIPEMAGVVRNAVPDCEILHACDGLRAIDILKSQAGKIDLILLDIVMDDMDGVITALKLRERDGEIPIRPFTAYDDPMASKVLSEIGCDSPILKPIEPDDLAREIRLSFGKKATIHLSDAVCKLLIRFATERLDYVRNMRSRRIGVFSSIRMKQGGLKLLVESSGYKVHMLLQNIPDVEYAAKTYDNLLLVAKPGELHIISEFKVSIICIAESLREALHSVEMIKKIKAPAALLVEASRFENEQSQKRVSEMIREAIRCVSEGRTFLPSEIEEPFQETLTNRESDFLKLEMQGISTEDISIKMSVKADTVRSLRKRVRERFNLEQDDDLREYVERWWFDMFFGNGM